MAFTERFDTFVCEGDCIACEQDGFRIVARIVRDDCPDAPDQRHDGFWPSLYKDAPGFIGPGNNFRERFARAQAESEAVMEAWRRDDWFYCGIVLSVSLDGVILDEHAISLWGVEANYPGSDNAHLTDAADELLADAIAIGLKAARRLCATLARLEARA
ncbi:hypothetical protein [Hyphomonas sp.]|uniref:hypothetical protein n=1 Tax=Hyphomonas sp. TaxID=87 RepID=UPI003F6F950D